MDKSEDDVCRCLKNIGHFTLFKFAKHSHAIIWSERHSQNRNNLHAKKRKKEKNRKIKSIYIFFQGGTKT